MSCDFNVLWFFSIISDTTSGFLQLERLTVYLTYLVYTCRPPSPARTCHPGTCQTQGHRPHHPNSSHRNWHNSRQKDPTDNLEIPKFNTYFQEYDFIFNKIAFVFTGACVLFKKPFGNSIQPQTHLNKGRSCLDHIWVPSCLRSTPRGRAPSPGRTCLPYNYTGAHS